ncbi:Peptidyl-prolyl cis-trans isomerase (fragment) [Candidatus Terasakiella magnetica]
MPLIGLVIDVLGEKFLFFDFSRNTDPSPLERHLAEIGSVGPVVIGLLYVGAALIFSGFHEILAILGCGFAVAVFLAFFGSFILPFLIIALTGFKVRPVIDDADGGDEEVCVVLQGSS